MTLSIRPIDPVNRPFFAGEVSGVDITQPLSRDEVAAIHAGMDHFGVLVFHDQRLDDEQQLAFSRNLGPLEQATGDIASAASDRRSAWTCNDISNLDKNNKVAGARRPAPAVRAGQPALALRQLVQARCRRSIRSCRRARIPPTGRQHRVRRHARGLRRARRGDQGARCDDLICEHSQIFSRGILGFTDFTDEERAKWAPVRQRLVRRHPVTGRLSLYLSSHAGGIEGWPVPEARAFLRDLNEHATQRAVRLCARLAAVRPGDVGQPRHHASRAPLRRRRRCATCAAPR